MYFIACFQALNISESSLKSVRCVCHICRAGLRNTGCRRCATFDKWLILYTRLASPIAVCIDNPAISYFSPVTGLFRKYVQEATHGRLNFTTTKKCHSLTIRNVSDITPLPILLISTWESKRVISECTHPPGLCVAVDPQTTNYHRTIVASPPHHDI